MCRPEPPDDLLPRSAAQVAPGAGVRGAGEPVVCGALGIADPAVLTKLVDATGPGLSPVHRGPRSVLFLDRPARSWRKGDQVGLWWGGDVAARTPAGWRDVALDCDGCGLVDDERRVFLHSDCSGLSQLYYARHGGATYFASRIDPLLRSLGGPLHIDWDAWAAIFFLGYPVGCRTPFDEVRRMPPFSCLRHADPFGAVVSEGPWPWAEIEPRATPRADVDIVEALRASLTLHGHSRVDVPLSGGWDSRLILCLLAERGGRGLRAWTTTKDDGRAQDERFAVSVAEALTVSHEFVYGDDASFWSDLTEALALMDFQSLYHVWYLPLIRRLRRSATTIVDGFGGGVLIKGQFVPRDTRPGTRDTQAALWNQESNEQAKHRVLREPLATGLAGRARRQFNQQAEAFAGHPNEATLTMYRVRMVPGIALSVSALFGRDFDTRTPFARPETAMASLAVPEQLKRDGRLYRAVFDAVNPRVGVLPSTNTAPRDPKTRPRRELSAYAIDGYARAIEAGPLTWQVSERVTAALPVRDLARFFDSKPSAHLVRAVATFSLWYAHYRHVLSGCDPSEAID